MPVVGGGVVGARLALWVDVDHCDYREAVGVVECVFDFVSGFVARRPR